jgi:hypothetical protein
MLTGLLLATGAALLITWACAWRATSVAYACSLIPAALAVVAGCMGGSTALFFVGLFLVLVALVCSIVAPRRRWFIASSLIAVCVAFGCTAYVVDLFSSRQQRLARENPFESLSGRLSYEQRFRRNSDKPVALAEDRLAPLERRFAKHFQMQMSPAGEPMTQREFMLREIHRSYVDRFVNEPGFGFMRMPDFLGEHRDEIKTPTPRQPAYASPSETGAGHETPPSTSANGPNPGAAKQLHENGLEDFLHPERFGYVRDRDQVAGFLPHRFSKLPRTDEKPNPWDVVRLELVSVLKSDEPGVYVSEYLPRMDELKDAKRRPLDAFEKTALQQLQEGEELRVSVAGDQMRMLGSIRALKQCLKCHQVERGELLGAFSYVLRRG